MLMDDNCFAHGRCVGTLQYWKQEANATNLRKPYFTTFLVPFPRPTLTLALLLLPYETDCSESAGLSDKGSPCKQAYLQLSIQTKNVESYTVLHVLMIHSDSVPQQYRLQSTSTCMKRSYIEHDMYCKI